MTPDPEYLAALHTDAMEIPAPWRASDFSELLERAGTFIVSSPVPKYPGVSLDEARGSAPAIFRTKNCPPATTQPAQTLTGFALGRVVLDEAELLTIAVAKHTRRQGLGRKCLTDFEAEAARLGARLAHLEVAATNEAALALYSKAGWQQTGMRRAYYKSPEGRIDAILMQKTLNPA